MTASSLAKSSHAGPCEPAVLKMRERKGKGRETTANPATEWTTCFFFSLASLSSPPLTSSSASEAWLAPVSFASSLNYSLCNPVKVVHIHPRCSLSHAQVSVGSILKPGFRSWRSPRLPLPSFRQAPCKKRGAFPIRRESWPSRELALW